MWISPRTSRYRYTFACAARRALIACIATLSGCTTLAPFEQMAAVRTPPPPTTEPHFEATEFPRAASEDSAAPRIASGRPSRQLVSAPPPFSWTPSARSAGGRPIQTVTVGRGSRQTLVVGSIGGDDEPAIRLTELLARHLYQNEIIFGGATVAVIRNLNPDGEAKSSHLNDHKVALHRAFPPSVEAPEDRSKLPPEIRFFLDELQNRRPDRVIHIRTTGRRQGIVAASESALGSAKDVADWLSFGVIPLPGKSASGTLERFVAERPACEVVTLAIPAATPEKDLWVLYGDALLNLLLKDDYATREMARRLEHRPSADRRHLKAADVPILDQPADMFREDKPAGDSVGTDRSGVDDLPPLP